MATADETGAYSQVDSTEAAMYIFGMFVLSSIGIGVSLIILLSFCRQRKQIKNTTSFRFAVLSVTCSLLTNWFIIFFCNNLLIPWQYDSKHQSFVSETDSVTNVFYFCGKITFYCSFTYNLLSLFDETSQSRTRKYLTIWMIVACFLICVMAFGYIIDDLTEQSAKEIGVSLLHNMYITMFLSHEGADYAKYFTLGTIAIDIVYFSILLYFYIKQLKVLSNNEMKQNGTQGVVLLFVACLVFWVFFIMIGINNPLKWVVGAIDIISDDICLFLMFIGQRDIYRFMCRGCDVCCGKCIFGSKGYGALPYEDIDDDVATDEQSEDLLANGRV